MMNTPLRINFAILLILFTIGAKGQDIHFSQFPASPININPALTGVFDGTHRFSIAFRNQWSNVPVNYLTFSGMYDRRFLPSLRNPKGVFSGGVIFNYDVSGDSRLSASSLGLSGSYTHKLNKRNFLTGGIQVSGAQRAFQLDDLRFDNQYDKYYQPHLPSGENFDNTSKTYFGLAGGVNWAHLIPSTRTMILVGAGAFNINQPDVSFWDNEEIPLDQRFSLHAYGNVQLTKNWDIVLQAAGQFQGPHQEATLGAYGKLHLNQQPTRQLALQLGAILRIEDAIAPAIAVFYKDWEGGFSYDINLSDFENASYYNGGPEVYVRYTIRPVPDLEFCPTCPKLL